jgi:hypothetical protein
MCVCVCVWLWIVRETDKSRCTFFLCAYVVLRVSVKDERKKERRGERESALY